VAWMEAFSIYSSIVASHFPRRSKDLSQYKLLILRTYRQFGGKVWLSYDKAFREHAAAINNVDWSTMDVQLYNFHSAGAQAKNYPALAGVDSAALAPSNYGNIIINMQHGNIIINIQHFLHTQQHECTEESSRKV